MHEARCRDDNQTASVASGITPLAWKKGAMRYAPRYRNDSNLKFEIVLN
jgi:hypothetical protein